LRKDSLFNFSLDDFGFVPRQRTLSYYVRSATDIPAAFMPNEVNIPDADTFTFRFDNGMKLDSMILEDSDLQVDVSSTFNHTGFIRITSPNMIAPNGQPFARIIQLSSSTGSFTDSKIYPIEDYTMVFGENDTTNIISLQFDVLLYRNPGYGISTDDFVKVDFTFLGIENYEAIYGFMGINEQSLDTIIETPFDGLGNLSGDLSVTNPKLNLMYTNSLGIPFGIDMDITGFFKESNAVTLQPGGLEIASPESPENPEVNGVVSFNRTTIPNIDSFLVFPPPTDLDIFVSATSNPDGDITKDNFILKNSALNVDLEIEIPLEFRADMQFTDTLELNLDEDNVIEEIEYFNLYYSVRNEFPINLDLDLVLYDSSTGTKVDTIHMSKAHDRGIMVAAPVDAYGLSIVDEVLEYQGYVSLTDEQATHLLENSDQVIIVASFSSTKNAQSVKILNTYALEFKIAVDASILIQTDLNE
ncbi:MAG: hypothetical protein ACOC10_01520, partial [Bacteroidota bacterium]